MPLFRVIAGFIDIQSGQHKKPGDTVEASGERVEVLKKAGVIGGEIPESSADPDEPTTQTDKSLLKHAGGGYYELPDGRKIKGKDAALEALAESGDENGAENGDPAGDGSPDAGGDND